MIVSDILNKHSLSHSFTSFSHFPYKVKSQLKIDHKTLTDSMYLLRNVTGYWKAKQYKRNLRTDISGSSSQDNIQTRAFTNSTNRLLIKFDILLYDKHHDVTVTLLMIGLPSYIRVSYRIQVVDSNFHLPWKAFRIRSNRHLNIVNKTKKYSKLRVAVNVFPQVLYRVQVIFLSNI